MLKGQALVFAAAVVAGIGHRPLLGLLVLGGTCLVRMFTRWRQAAAVVVLAPALIAATVVSPAGGLIVAGSVLFVWGTDLAHQPQLLHTT